MDRLTLEEIFIRVVGQGKVAEGELGSTTGAAPPPQMKELSWLG